MAGAAFAATLTAWTYEEKVAAQSLCGDEYTQDSPELKSCLFGVTVYADGRQWSELSWSKQRAEANCLAMDAGSSEPEAYRFGCSTGRRFD
ncbi:MAG: hypothetical protein AAFV72_00440 [Cyanobacteria bacterium J06635_1]